MHEVMNFTLFSLEFIDQEGLPSLSNIYEPRFGGHQTLEEREQSFFAKNQTLHCGFIKGPPGFSSTGFDIDAKDKAYKNECKIAVSSCIFGSSDFLRRPTSKKVNELVFIEHCECRALVKLFWHREEPSPPGPPPLFTKDLPLVYAGMETEVKTKLMSAAYLARLNGLIRCRLVAAAEPEWLKMIQRSNGHKSQLLFQMGKGSPSNVVEDIGRERTLVEKLTASSFKDTKKDISTYHLKF
ncbi:Protein of unknown function D [Prunus dulcis]|uniref:TOD1/MUCI70 glycosyltransferase-like domain-containing protein n=1 Tax=Prunus dulcis TaxID=3755 RepID=A0A4Y1RAP5_PRUDU|nr:Protein of unknown function D [Prunus dulcis]